MKTKRDPVLTKKKVLYYLDEAFIILIILISVICAEAVHKAIKGKFVTWADFIIDIPNLIIAALMAISLYGGMYTRPYSEKAKAHLSKRIAMAIQVGISWRLMIGGS